MAKRPTPVLLQGRVYTTHRLARPRSTDVRPFTETATLAPTVRPRPRRPPCDALALVVAAHTNTMGGRGLRVVRVELPVRAQAGPPPPRVAVKTTPAQETARRPTRRPSHHM